MTTRLASCTGLGEGHGLLSLLAEVRACMLDACCLACLLACLLSCICQLTQALCGYKQSPGLDHFSPAYAFAKFIYLAKRSPANDSELLSSAVAACCCLLLPLQSVSATCGRHSSNVNGEWHCTSCGFIKLVAAKLK
jgi:hypothetical protein